jgi:3-hydroxyisobutyrate dehydrogenase
MGRTSPLSFAGIVAAKAGTLTIMFGSPSPIATSLAVPFLQRMARDDGVIPCGSTGAGVGVKVCNK